MTSVAQPVPVAGPVFLRQLARLGGGADVGQGPPLAATLAQWIDWHRAVALAGALDDRLPEATEPPSAESAPGEACAQRHAQLREAILADPLLSTHGRTTEVAATEFAPFRACHLAHQRAMLAATGRLRGRLRDLLGTVPRLARLGEVDAALERALAPREHALLGQLPDLLADHFERMRAQAEAAGTATGAWLDRFRLDLRELLLAELDLRFSPVQALLAALRTADSTP
ncbi:DUF3348 family protein [Luteimonas composti]|uniref:DUF3348 family protein n=1 Tax=Luteimonas composti TaxID=398257 RepID=A0ABT6MSV9_9GAMM|nr:DUF3348 family protein [Luteimonas composti]MDH7453341.1 DUF3348 family protein [Luteimonas composti]